ncbi:Hint domain-containing protein [Maliponia aquimaris]|uniref:Hedgehog/Intein (Hint) domain-containing protein n=1 Tax=Maliponia aquimaris TaxID=1673631 RepID=A0A238KZD6_9RHOB|nr:Hint domain-containing protein [Maliponia aquimaris]SMX47446.1 hypothetical protein MAA8898_03660 [Maliponia aquimaris]
MPFSIYAEDNSFAVSTGSNVRATSMRSRFDDNPNVSKDLVITTKAGDAEPRLFEVGDTYDISFGGSGGTKLLDAVVLRSDTRGGDTGVIVFEGTDQNGALTQVVWTPNVDLENWYWTNFTQGTPPQFYYNDMDSNYTHEYICFEQSVRVATPRGYVRVDKLEVGQTVCTWGGTKREVRWLGHKSVDGTGSMAPVRFAKGTIGNFATVKLSPQHRVLISAPEADLQFGASEVLVPAISLVDGKNVRQVQKETVTYVHILLDRHDILIAEGAPCESLFPGLRTRELLSAEDRAAISSVTAGFDGAPCRPLLRRAEGALIAPLRRVPEREMAQI